MQFLDAGNVSARLKQFKDKTVADHERFIGFPAGRDGDSAGVQQFTGLFLNNVGDPHVESWHGAHSKEFEREVVDFFAEFFRAPANNYWGYVTTGGTEGNLYALYVARQVLPGAVAYYSDAAHYGIAKILHLLNVPTRVVKTQPSGEMDYAHLNQLLGDSPDKPAIVLATIGTTMTEAKDDVTVIKAMLHERGVDHYIHADAALAGGYLPLLQPRHSFDFKDGADSVSVSGHKFFASPMPCGVVVVKKQYRDKLGAAQNYTGSIDTTITGSRNGHTVLFLWHMLQRHGVGGLRKRAVAAQQLAEYTHKQLRNIGWECWRNPGSLTVMLVSPPRDMIAKWQLATHDGWSHVICMPGVTKQHIDEFVTDLAALGAAAP